jgi:hypothetical protein
MGGVPVFDLDGGVRPVPVLVVLEFLLDNGEYLPPHGDRVGFLSGPLDHELVFEFHGVSCRV